MLNQNNNLKVFITIFIYECKGKETKVAETADL